MDRHPWFARMSFSRPPLGPNALRLFDTTLAELEPLGLDAPTRMGFVQTVLGQVFSAGLAALEERAMRERVGLPGDDDLAAAVAPFVERVAARGEHPHYVRWATDPGRLGPGAPGFEQVLDWLLDGLAASLQPSSSETSARNCIER